MDLFEPSASFFLHLVGVRESGPPMFSLFRLCRSFCVGYAVDDVCGDACKVVSGFSR